MKQGIWIMAAVLIFWCTALFARAEDSGVEEEMDAYDFSEIEQVLEKGEVDLSFGDVVYELLTGDTDQLFQTLLQEAAEYLWNEIGKNKEGVLQVFMIAAAGALFSNFAAIFRESQIAQTAFFITYLMMLSVLAASFGLAGQIASDMIRLLLEFMKALIPAFFLSVAFVSGSLSSMAFYQAALIMIAAVEWGMLYLLIPLIYVELVLRFVNDISGEDVLSKTAELIHTVIAWGLKTMMGLVIGIQLIQGLILPFVDAAKMGGLKKILSFIPGIGSGAATAAQMVVGSGVLIKNGIGAAALVVILVICAVPVVKLTVLTLMYRLAAAIIQPISDARMVRCVSSVGDGIQMLLKTACSAVLLFFITIALICSFTNTAYFG